MDNSPQPTEENLQPLTDPQLQTIIPIAIGNQLQTENMETHHPHHVTHKKKWGEYFLEFFMLFLAVFLGFVAENWRENIVEHEKEKQYMQSFVSDLQNDTANLNAGFPLKEQRLKSIDSVFLFFKANPDVKIIPGTVYRYMARSNWDRHYRRNSTTIDQLKNAGGLRLVRKKNVADSIAALDLQWTRMEFYREAYITMQNMGRSMLEKIFNANDLLQKYIDNSTGNSMPQAMTDSLKIRINIQYLNEYLNFLNHQKTNTLQDERNYKNLEQSAERLIALIKKEYHLK
jgi:hypothetical protein